VQIKKIVNAHKEASQIKFNLICECQPYFSFNKRLEEQDLVKIQWMMKPTLSLQAINI
jgi:hypothetical protein